MTNRRDFIKGLAAVCAVAGLPILPPPPKREALTKHGWLTVPEVPYAGDLMLETSEHKMYFYDGTVWRQIDARDNQIKSI